MKAAISSLALVLAMSFTGAASAATMFNGANLSEEDYGRVQAKCNTLMSDANSGSSQTLGNDVGTSGDDSSTPDDQSSVSDDTNAMADDTNGVDQALTTIDLDAVTLEQCKEAGFGSAM